MPAPAISEQLQAAYRTALARYGGAPGVTGVDIGYATVDGVRTTDLVVRVHMGGVTPHLWAASASALPEEINGQRVEMVPATYHLQTCPPAESLLGDGSRFKRAEHIRPGLSISHRSASEGTLGLIVFDEQSGAPCILSNRHILAGAPGAKQGDPIVQPSTGRNGGGDDDTIATLERCLPEASVDGDAAIARLSGARAFDLPQWDTGVVVQSARMPAIGDVLVKSGAGTGVTCGQVDGTGRYFLLARPGDDSAGVPMDGFRIVRMKDDDRDDVQVSNGGDSGSVWYGIDDKAGVGLHAAGDTPGRGAEEHAVAAHLPVVLKRLRVTLVPPETVAAVVQREAPFPDLVEAPPPGEEPVLPGGTTVMLAESVARLTRMLEQAMSSRTGGSES